MAKDRNRAEYEQRVNRVVDHIRTHLADELTLEGLAHVAAFSPFHFHRIFKAMTGENLGELIQRSRLESAASQLRFRPNADILAIAMDNGFGSASAFARAFKERFGMTATAWRERPGCAADGKPGEADRNPRQALRKASTAPGDGSSHVLQASDEGAGAKETTMTVTVKTFPSYHVAYMRNTGPYGAGGGIPDLWMRLARWAGPRDLWTPDRICIGVALDDPMVTAPEKCRYDAAIVIPQDLEVDSAVTVTDIPGGKHAVTEFTGSSRDIAAAWTQLYDRWLPESGYQPDNSCFERYLGEAWDAKTDSFRCELACPSNPFDR